MDQLVCLECRLATDGHAELDELHLADLRESGETDVVLDAQTGRRCAGSRHPDHLYFLLLKKEYSIN